ncbi:hypothetical protein STENM327S_04828 [Streptomyces tendae]
MVTIAMSVMFTPSAVRPPSANRMPCMSRTTETHSTPVQGPTRIAASAPPSRWPLVLAATGKFSICTAKMNAATSPASGAVRSSSSRRAPRRLTAMAPAAIIGHGGGRGVDESVRYMHGSMIETSCNSFARAR